MAAEQGTRSLADRQPEALAAELRRWLGDAALRKAAGARTRPFVREHYDWSKIAARWADHECPWREAAV